MAIDPKLLVIKPVDELTEVTGLQDGDLLFYDGSGSLKRISIETFNNLSKTAKPLKPTDATPTVAGLYMPTEIGTYTNAGGLIAEYGFDTIFYFNGTTWTKRALPYPKASNNLPQFADLSFPVTNTATEKVQCVDNFVPYQLLDGKTSTSADTPSTSPTIWKSMGVVNQTITNITQEFNVDPSQIVPSEALYNDETLAGDILKRVDKNTGENINYRETTTWHDDTPMTDAKADGVMFIKKGGKFYERQYTGAINVKWFGAKGDNTTNDTEAFRKAHNFIKSSIPPNQLKPAILFVPRGNYIIENFEIDTNGFQIIGEGSKNTLFKFVNSMGSAPAGIYFKNAVLDTSSPDHKFYNDIKIENIGCDPSTIPNDKSFIQIRNCYDFLVRGVDVDTDSFALVNKFALEISDNVFTGSVENCYLPKVNCNASIAWTITTITFINLRSMNVRMNKCLGMTFIQPVVQGNENEKFYINNCDTITIMGGDMENGGIFLNFGTNNSNIRSFGNNILALGGAYSNGEIPQNSYFDDKGNVGIGMPNVNGLFGKQLIKGLANSVVQTLMSAGGNAYQVLGNEDGGANAKFTYVASASNYRTWGKISDDMATKTEFMRLTDSGNLLVGTTEDIGAKLCVNGIIGQNVATHTEATAGTATALPSQPKGYYETNINGETVRVPFY